MLRLDHETKGHIKTNNPDYSLIIRRVSLNRTRIASNNGQANEQHVSALIAIILLASLQE